MTTKKLTCIECPMGCAIETETEGERVLSVKGNGCPRGRMYAENEVICPRRVVTSTVRAYDGTMVPVKTAQPVKKEEMFAVIEKIAAVHPRLPVRVGDILYRGIADGIDLVAAGNAG